MIAEFYAKALAEIVGVKLVVAANHSTSKGRDSAAGCLQPLTEHDRRLT